MRYLPIAATAAAIALAAPLAYSQGSPSGAPSSAAPAVTVETPKPKCEDPGDYPGRLAMQTESRRKSFIKAIETYKTCMMNFVEERKATIKANETAARTAIDTYNARMKYYNDEQGETK
jgi:hypothetical protein